MTQRLAEECGALLARLHVLADGWADDRIPVTDRRGLLMESVAADVALAGARLWRSETRSFLERNAAALARLEAQPRGPLHHDLHRQNLLVADGEVTAVLDFDELDHGPLIIDLARFFHYLAVEEADRRLPAALAEAAVRGYQRVRPLVRHRVGAAAARARPGRDGRRGGVHPMGGPLLGARADPRLPQLARLPRQRFHP